MLATRTGPSEAWSVDRSRDDLANLKLRMETLRQTLHDFIRIEAWRQVAGTAHLLAALRGELDKMEGRESE